MFPKRKIIQLVPKSNRDSNLALIEFIEQPAHRIYEPTECRIKPQTANPKAQRFRASEHKILGYHLGFSQPPNPKPLIWGLGFDLGFGV